MENIARTATFAGRECCTEFRTSTSAEGVCTLMRKQKKYGDRVRWSVFTSVKHCNRNRSECDGPNHNVQFTKIAIMFSFNSHMSTYFDSLDDVESTSNVTRKPASGGKPLLRLCNATSKRGREMLARGILTLILRSNVDPTSYTTETAHNFSVLLPDQALWSG
jgi:hypothetical protein